MDFARSMKICILTHIRAMLHRNQSIDLKCSLVSMSFKLAYCGLNKIYWKQPPELFCSKFVLKNFAKFRGKHLCWRLFFNKVVSSEC